MKETFSFSGFILRHLVASAISVIAPMVIVVITYIVLLGISIFISSSSGISITLLLWPVFTFIVSIIYTAILLFPSVLIAEITSRIFGKWQRIAQIPVSCLFLILFIYGLCLLAHYYPNYSAITILHWADYPFILFLALAIPLGIYWWTIKLFK